ncbi:methylated-DNA--[protein]-cysteine S-methyltransferase [Novipirellula artificiosorum]|uniref:methylated-DNA--[protein]-cysteine S-methyltransferase n=1 Tax=Novipirellula artificiosorum TaxID=2528016 RepID=A0A5C6D8B4_9BACT|nr:methylated-DNA--[protein]-cysteine S-methyltransferase [Novipirellula artificiosorum]TWU33028.1 Methylated-DNA--protein-cysteine methyltransferase [Novipirellula artificiosorum]
MQNLCYALKHDSPIGPLWSYWTKRGLYRLQWADTAQPEWIVDETLGSASAKSAADKLDVALIAFFAGHAEDFAWVRIDSLGWTPFADKVYRKCREIKPGSTMTYKQLAQRAGNERASRAVGSAMARNRVPIVIPCHRVVSSSGGLSGFSAPGGLETKRLLLELESD